MSGRPLKVGLILPQIEGMAAGRTAGWSDLLAFARAAEDAGFDSVWLVDHFLLTPPAPGAAPFGAWECGVLLGALAATTRRVELGTFVVCTGFRNPALLAKVADAVEEVSGGRLILGVGAGNTEYEHRAFGYPFDHRTSRFAEALAILHALLRTGRADFEGKYHRAAGAELRPRGPRPGGPPIVVGTTGERGLRLAARYGDGWNTAFGRTGNRPAGVAPLRVAVDAACAAEGRDPATLGRSVGVLVEVDGAVPYPPGQPAWNRDGTAPPLRGSPAELAEAFRAFAREGIDHLQVWVNPTTPAGVECLAQALGHLDRS